MADHKLHKTCKKDDGTVFTVGDQVRFTRKMGVGAGDAIYSGEIVTGFEQIEGKRHGKHWICAVQVGRRIMVERVNCLLHSKIKKQT